MFTGIVSHQGLFRGYHKARSEMAVEAPGLVSKLSPATAWPSTAPA